MKKIKITIVSAGRGELPDCSDLLEECPDVSVLARLDSLNDAGAWVALGRSDVLILDEAVIVQEGAEDIRGLHAAQPSLRSLLILDNDNEINVIYALSLGITSVVRRDALPAVFCRAIAATYTGEAWVSRRLVEPIRDELARLNDTARLTGQSGMISSLDKLH